MGDYGIKVSLPGYNVKTCADRQLAFSSSFKGLKIVKSGKLNVGDSGTVAHNLGYIPAFNVFSYYSSPSGYRVFPYATVDATNLYIGTISVPVSYYIFGHDLTEIIFPTNIDTTPISQGTISNDYGIKVSKDGKDVKTAGVDDLSITSKYGNYIIHKSGYILSSLTQELNTISHGLGYVPHFLAFSRKTTESVVHGIHINVLTLGLPSADATNIYFDNLTSDQFLFYYIIFKESI
jgi:hypothetical protein